MLSKTILVVEDDTVARGAMAGLLKERGYQAMTAGNGKEALTSLEAGARPDLILLDLWMPGGDGWEFRERQRLDKRLASIPVIILSSVADAAEWADALGDVGYLRKPINPETLFVAIERFAFGRGAKTGSDGSIP